MRTPSQFPGRILRYLALSLVEARPYVLVIFMFRFLCGAVVAGHSSAWTVGAGPQAGWSRLAQTLAAAGAWECAVLFTYLLNGITDVHGDRINGSRRPIARGALPIRAATAVTATAATAALAGALTVGGSLPVLVAAALALGFLYSCPPCPLKCTPAGTFLCGVGGGLLTYYAGFAAHLGVAWPTPDPPLIIFAVTMSLWMGTVGVPAKDLTDVEGDTVAGRRTVATVVTARRLGWCVSAVAVVLAVLLLGVGLASEPVLVRAGVALAAGAVAVVAVFAGSTKLFRAPIKGQPYMAFMGTQYMVHCGLITHLWI